MQAKIRSRKPRKSAKKRMLIIDGASFGYADLACSGGIGSG
jgi:hypothetical protein